MHALSLSFLGKTRSLLFLVPIFMLGCELGKEGEAGPEGPEGPQGLQGPAGESGSSGPTLPSEITDTMSADISDASIAEDGITTVTFTLANDKGYPFIGLESGRIRFTFNQLIPANATTGDPAHWLSYINKTEEAPTDPELGSGTEAQIQATYESNGSLVDNEDGSYTYTFAVNPKSVTEPVAITYNAQYTHRVAFQISGGGYPTLNRTYDWQPSTGATTSITSKEMVLEGTCNGCHGELALHGGGRVDTAYCVTCHNPGTVDANSSENLDFSVMVHKIHTGANLPSVVAGGEYAIWGYRDSKHDYSGVHLPQDVRNCTNCHDETNEETPDAGNWMSVSTIAVCGSCHDDVDFAQGEAGGHKGGVATDNSECASCHGEGKLSPVREKHLGVMENKQSVAASVTATPEAIRIDQTTGNVEVDVRIQINGENVAALRDGEDVDTASGAVLGKYKYGTDNGALAINWDNGNGYQLNHQEVDFNDCTADGAGLFTCAAEGLLAGITDADVVSVMSVDLFACMNEKAESVALANCETESSADVYVVQVPVTPVQAFFNGDGSVAETGYDKNSADITACRTCHADNTFHHAATELTQCKTCHNATRASSRGRPGDLKHHVHRYHSGIDDDDIIPVEAGDTDHYPNNISVCTACHTEDQVDIPLQVNSRPSVANRDNPVYLSPTVVVCAACHTDVPLGYINPALNGLMDPENGTISKESQAVIDHMIQNGGVFGAATYEEANKVESCSVCHAKGKDYGIDKVHKFSQ